MMTVFKQLILITLLASFSAGCNVFEDIEDNEGDSGIENPDSEDSTI